MQVIIPQARQQAEAIGSLQIKCFLLPRKEMGNWPMSAENTFRLAGRAGSESDVSGIIRIKRNAGLIFRIMTEEICDFIFHSRKRDATGDFNAIKKKRKLLWQLARRFHL